MKDKGYLCADDHVHTPWDDLGAMQVCEGLDFGTILSWWNGMSNPVPSGQGWVVDAEFAGEAVGTAIYCAEKEDSYGAVYINGMQNHLSLAYNDHRSNLPYVQEGDSQGALVCYQGGWSREVLIDALNGCADVVNVCNNNFHRHKFQPRSIYGNLLGISGFPVYADTPEGMMQMNTDTYYRLLNCGLHLAAGAGSAVGAKSTPIGYNRTYVRADANATMSEFLQLWSEGRNFVTNGPMVFLSTTDGNRPGDEIDLPSGGAQITFEVEAFTEQPMRTLEIVANGQVVADANLAAEQYYAQLSTAIDINEGMWIAARCTEEDLLLSSDEMEAYRQGSGTFRKEPCRLRFAHTSPIYVTVDGQDANVLSSITEVNQMLDAFETFAIERTNPAYLQEILDAIPESIE
jgi:hypothetical protein